MALFDFSGFHERVREFFKKDYDTSRSVQDEVKVYNERFPEYLNPLYDMLDDIEGGGVGEFGESGGMTGDTNQQKIWSYFVGKGFTKESTAGIIGNFQQESGCDPEARQSPGPGRGLAQWGEGQDGGRFDQLKAWASPNGSDPYDMQTQLDWTWHEMNMSSYKSAFASRLQARGYSPGSDAIKAFGELGDITDAVYIFELAFERAGHKAYDNRVKYAKEVYEELKDWDGTVGGGMGEGNQVFPVNPSSSGVNFFTRAGNKEMGFGPSSSRADGFHAGHDIGAGGNTNLRAYSMQSGKVTHAGFTGGWGNNVRITYDDGYHMLYAHLASMTVKAGQTVSRGQRVGIVGNTGGNYAVHLHVELSTTGKFSDGNTIDPQNYLGITGSNTTTLESPRG